MMKTPTKHTIFIRYIKVPALPVSDLKGRTLAVNLAVNQGNDDALPGPRLLAPAPDSLVFLAAAGLA